MYPWFKSLIFKQMDLGWKFNNLFFYGEESGIGVETGFGVTQEEIR